MANLQYLNVAYNVMLDADFVAIIRKCKRLKTLVLDGCNAINVVTLSSAIMEDMLELKYLSLASCRVLSDKLLNAIEMSTINTLCLRDNPMASACSWTTLGQDFPVTELDLSETSMKQSDLRYIMKLPRIRILSLNRVEKLASAFALGQVDECSKLSRLSMIASELSIDDLKDIARHFPELEELELLNSVVKGDTTGAPGLVEMKALRVLGLHGVPGVDTAFVKELSKLKELENLDVSKTEVGDAIFESLLNCTKLRTLDVSDCEGISVRAVSAFQAERPGTVVVTSSSRDAVPREEK